MKRQTRFAVLILLVASGAFATDDAYKFKAAWAHNQFEFTSGDGTRWRWLTSGCGKAECKVKVDAVGSNTESQGDLLFTHTSGDVLHVECVREAGCSVGVNADSKWLAKGDGLEVPSGALVEFSASTPPSSSGNH